MAEDCGFRIRVDDRLRKEFIEACRKEDSTAAQTLRAFMRAYVQGSSARAIGISGYAVLAGSAGASEQ